MLILLILAGCQSTKITDDDSGEETTLVDTQEEEECTPKQAFVRYHYT